MYVVNFEIIDENIKIHGKCFIIFLIEISPIVSKSFKQETCQLLLGDPVLIHITESSFYLAVLRGLRSKYHTEDWKKRKRNLRKLMTDEFEHAAS